jgi:hypothetical protein
VRLAASRAGLKVGWRVSRREHSKASQSAYYLVARKVEKRAVRTADKKAARWAG